MHTQLFVAASGGHAETVRALLVELGTDVHPRGADGITPLHTAAVYGPSNKRVCLLLHLGANVHAQTKNGARRCMLLLMLGT